MNFYRTLLFSCILLFSSTAVLAQTTGKIAGKITDADGKPLPGVNVVIKGTTQGSSTNLKGEYFLLNLKPENYTLVISMVGYQKQTITNVKVQTGRTTRINVQLEEQTFEGEEVVVTAEEEMVKMDQTSASAKVDSKELLNSPAESFSDAIAVQAGVSEGEDGALHIRGGRNSEIKYYVDGVAVSNPFNNALAVPVENTAVQEVEVISGTFNAEYGQANSGIVNIVTRSGSSEFEGLFRSSVGGFFSNNTEQIFDIDESSNIGQKVVEGSLSGPTGIKGLTFFTNARYTNKNGWLKGRRIFMPQDSSDFSSNNPNRWEIESTGDSTVVPMNPSLGNTVMGKLTYQLNNHIKLSYSTTRSFTKSKFYNHRFRLNPEFMPTQRNTSFNQLLVFNHTLGERTFYNVRLSAFSTDFSQFVFEDPFDERYKVIENRDNQPSDVFNTGGVDNTHINRESETYAARFDISRQFGTSHLVKAGFEYRYHDLEFEQFDIRALPINNFERTIPPVSSQQHNNYDKNPVEISAFIQDKVEIKDLIINAGIRFDYFDPNSIVPTDLRDPGNSRNAPFNEAFRDADVKTQVSPRVGFAFPISPSGVIHASYGIFFQIPQFSQLYENPEFEVSPSSFSQFIGNADLEAQESTMYEIGLQQQLGENVAIDLTTYYRDQRELVGTALYSARTGGDNWGRFENNSFGRVRGVTLATKIRTDVGVIGSINYTFQSAKGTESNPKQAFFDRQNNNSPLRNLIALDWDQRHNISSSLSYATEHLSVGLLSQFHTGFPFTPVDNQRIEIIELRNEALFDSEFTIDLRAAYQFKLSGVDSQIFFNAKNILDFSRDNREPQLFPSEIEAHNNNGKNLINTLRDFRFNPAVQPSPREVRLGVQFSF